MYKRSKFALSVLALLVLALLAFQTPLLRHARGATWSLWSRTVARVFSIGPLNIDNNVSEQLSTLMADNVRLKAVERDYARLKEQLGTPAFSSLRTIPVEIGIRPLDTFKAQLVLTKGAADGLTIGAPVVIYSSTLLCFITELREHTAICQLLLSPHTSTPAEAATNSNAKGLVEGRHYTSLVFTTIPRDVKLEVHQDIVTTAREGVPAGLLIGRVATIYNEENKAYQETTLALPYDPDAIRAAIALVQP